MYKHHSDSIKKITEKLKIRESVKAILLVGTIAQGFEMESSDIDLMIIVDEKEFQTKRRNNELKLYDNDCTDYNGGYIDGKYTSLEYIKQVALKGSEAARYAFKDAKILYSEIEELQSLIRSAIRYPVEEKSKRIRAFCSQMIAWCWYANEAIKENNKYLLNFSVPNVILFGGRAILSLNETLYPYHKWFMKVLEEIPVKPDDMMMQINGLLSNPSKGEIIRYCDSILEFVGLDKNKIDWADEFVTNNEMNWLYLKTPIIDI